MAQLLSCCAFHPLPCWWKGGGGSFQPQESWESLGPLERLERCPLQLRDAKDGHLAESEKSLSVFPGWYSQEGAWGWEDGPQAQVYLSKQGGGMFFMDQRENPQGATQGPV